MVLIYALTSRAWKLSEPPVMPTGAMSSHSRNTVTDELLQHFKALLIKIFSDLEKEKVDALWFYYDKDIPKNICGTFNFLTALEDAGKISWTNVSSLKTVLSAIGREVLGDALEEFEITRNIALLLDAFVRIRKCIPRQNRFEDIEVIAGHLANSTDSALDKNKFKIRSLRKSKKSIEEVMISSKEKIETNLSKPWTKKLALLIVIAGELLSESKTKNEKFVDPQPEDVMRCSAEICSTMTSLDEWVRRINRRS